MSKKELRLKLVKYIGFYAGLVALSFLRALGTYMFIVPNGFAPGGLSGLASIIYNGVLPFNQGLADTWLNAGVTVFYMNVPLLILAYFKLNKVFVFNTALCVTFYAFFMWILGICGVPVFQAGGMESGFMLVAALVGGVMIGISMGIMLLINMSMGGTDIIGKIVYEKNPVVNVQWIIFMFDIIVVMMSGVLGFIGAQYADADSVFVKVMSPIFYSFISLYVTTKVVDVIGNGIQSSVVFHIITDKHPEIVDIVAKQLKRGATVIHAEGAYTHAARDILICVVRRKQIVNFKRIIKSVDPNAFCYITNTREVNGFGFKSF
ncbi:MAG: YitT family protein [Clostridia bacterium]|nr:YitT family protein [Clostridia bacterium]